MTKSRQLLIGLGSFLVINLLVIDVYLWRTRSGSLKKPSANPLTTIFSNPQPDSTESATPEATIGFCPNLCLDAIREATASLEPVTQVVTREVVKESASKVDYVPLGSARLTSQDGWQDTGAQAYLDLKDYPQAKEVYFQVSMYLPSGNGRVSARLINVNENIEVWNSEVWVEGTTPTMATSTEPIRIWEGNKLYRVQLKTSMAFDGVLDSARLKIVMK